MKVGDSVSGYVLLKSCGKGAFGEVFLAEDFSQQKVALKVIEQKGYIANRELQALRDYVKCCQHESLMKILHAEQKEDYFYYTMELADNLKQAEDVYVPDTLAERLKRHGAFTVQETLNLAIQILGGLKVLHSNGLIHRDIKPANILWIRGQAKLGDIGLLAHDSSMTYQAGTPGFMPPVNLGIRSNSPQLDLYALAQVLYCCLTGGNDADPDDLDLSEDLQKNGQKLFQTINLLSQRNSQIQTTDQFLESITAASPSVRETAQSGEVSATKKEEEKPSLAGDRKNISLYDDDLTLFDYYKKKKVPAFLYANVPRDLKVKGLTTEKYLAAVEAEARKKRIKEEEERVRELEMEAEELKRQNEHEAELKQKIEFFENKIKSLKMDQQKEENS